MEKKKKKHADDAGPLAQNRGSVLLSVPAGPSLMGGW